MNNNTEVKQDVKSLYSKSDWFVSRSANNERWQIEADRHIILQHTFDGQIARANVDRVVKCVNAHDELVKALQKLMLLCKHIPKETFTEEGENNFQSALNNGAEALKKANQ